MLKIINYHSHADLFQQIDAQTSILTPNRRLSATLHKRYQDYQITLHRKAWVAPDILPVFSWIERFYQELTRQNFNTYPFLLNALQEQFLWENILRHSEENEALLQLTETAELAQSAFALLKQWQINIHDDIFKTQEDYAALQNWASQFEEICQGKNWIDSASLPNLITSAIKKNIIKPAPQIFLIGFTEISPQLKDLLLTCAARQSIVKWIGIVSAQHSQQIFCASNPETEILTIARFAKSTAKKHPHAKIGCVIPSLNQDRDRIKQIFSEVFAAESSHTLSQEDNYFNISAGKNLNQYPIIEAATQFLSLSKPMITRELFSNFLTSPFLGEAESERLKRAYFDVLLRQSNIHKLDLRPLLNEQNDHEFSKKLSLTKYCPALAKRLRCFFSLMEESNPTQSFGHWATLFMRALSLLGFPGERSLNSQEYQVVENWLHFLTDFMSLDRVALPVHYPEALQKLNKMLANYTFQPQSAETNIQVLGVLEAAGLAFDFLWVAQMDDANFPPQPKPNPFIPKSLQRALQMPHATAERELFFCRQLTQQFKNSAPYLIFSYPEKDKDADCRASPLIEHLPHVTHENLSLESYATPAKRIYESRLKEYLCDEQAPSPFPDETIMGGVDLIKQQALCPFKAFAKYRLRANELESPMLGLRPKDRGNIIHQALEILWNEINDHAELISLSDEKLNSIIHEAIHATTTFAAHLYVDRKAYLELEKKRLYHLLHDWVQLEKERKPFKVILNETSGQITLNQLTLNFRIDRIDEIENGQKIIIDYKTGRNNEINSWFGARPDEPQLPLYSLISPSNTSGIAFAQVASGEHCFKGISRFALEIKGIKLVSEIKKAAMLSWEDQINQWKIIFTQLSDDFYAGKANVDPKNNHTCLLCAFKPLCRVNEEIDALC